MHALGKSPSAKLSVRAPAKARRWARVRPLRLSFLLGGDDPENRIVAELPAAGLGLRRAVHVLCFLKSSTRREYLSSSLHACEVAYLVY
jgi:hypothetical protein